MIPSTIPQTDEVFKGYTILDVLRHVNRSTPIIDVHDAVITALAAFKALEIPELAVADRRMGVVGVLTGYNLISHLYRVALTSPEKLWAALYKTPVYDVQWITLSGETTMNLVDLVARMRARMWGFTSVYLGEAQYLLSILDVVRFLVSSGALERTSLRLLDIATENVVSVEKNLTIFKLMDVMMRRRVRRVVLEGDDHIITDRGILQYLASNPVLEILRDNPSKVIETSLDALTAYASKPVILSGDTPLSTVFSKMIEKEPYTVLTQDRKHILTPWDITKLLKKGEGV